MNAAAIGLGYLKACVFGREHPVDMRAPLVFTGALSSGLCEVIIAVDATIEALDGETGLRHRGQTFG